MIIVVIILTSVIQSLFGVGVLLFGTPMLLLLGYDFVYVLNILLPISMIINFFQLIQDREHINFEFYRSLLKYTIIPIILVLYFSVTYEINASLYIGLFLMFISLKSFIPTVSNIITYVFKYEKIFLIFMGTIHGMTNLGGSLLTSKVFSLNMTKICKRATISISYFTFALFQITTMYFIGSLNYFSIQYLLLGLFVYTLVDKLVYRKITDNKYDSIFAIVLFISGLMLFFKGL